MSSLSARWQIPQAFFMDPVQAAQSPRDECRLPLMADLSTIAVSCNVDYAKALLRWLLASL